MNSLNNTTIIGLKSKSLILFMINISPYLSGNSRSFNAIFVFLETCGV